MSNPNALTDLARQLSDLADEFDKNPAAVEYGIPERIRDAVDWAEIALEEGQRS